MGWEDTIESFAEPILGQNWPASVLHRCRAHVHYGSVWTARVPVHDYDMLCEGLTAWNTSKYDALGESTLFGGLLYVR